MAPRGTYRQIADDLRRLIESGELPSGAMLPSEMSLAEEWSVARGTARAALTILVEEGLVEVVPGQGRRVVGDAWQASPRTAWQRIARTLRDRLEAGEYGVSRPLPSEADLVAEFQVSRNTVRRAYRQLVDEGLVVVRHGSGAYPAPR